MRSGRTSERRGTQSEVTGPRSSGPPRPPGHHRRPPDPVSAKMRLQNQVAQPERPQRAPNAPPTRRHQPWLPPATWSPRAWGPRIPDPTPGLGSLFQLRSGGSGPRPTVPLTSEIWVGASPHLVPRQITRQRLAPLPATGWLC